MMTGAQIEDLYQVAEQLRLGLLKILSYIRDESE